jgi:hypothetical protein
VLAIFANDIAWHVPGRSLLSADHRGHAEVAGPVAGSAMIAR